MRRGRSAAAAGIALSIAVALAAAVGVAPQAAGAKACGTERWAVKTLTDPAAAEVDLTHVKVTTVEALRRLKVPKAWSDTAARVLALETTSFRVNALLMSMKREADSDIHLVIADPKIGGSMIAEFPAASCTVGASAQARALMKQAREAIAAACGGEPGNTVVTLRGRALLTGVGFFDRIHRQGGVAPNGIELHPVIDSRARAASG